MRRNFPFFNVGDMNLNGIGNIGIGNIGAVAAGHLLNGGTAIVSYSENYDATENVTLSGSKQT